MNPNPDNTPSKNTVPPGSTGAGQAPSTNSGQAGSTNSGQASSARPAGGTTDGGQVSAKPTKKTKAEIRAAFRDVFGDVAKAKRDAERLTAAKRLKPYREEIRLLREAGYSWKKIAVGMRKPRIGEQASAETLKALFGQEEANKPKPKAE